MVGRKKAVWDRTIMARERLELWRYQYNHERPHQSLHLLTPTVVYFQYRRHKKHYDL